MATKRLILVLVVVWGMPMIRLSAASPSPAKPLSNLDVKGFEETDKEPVNWESNPFVKPTLSLAADELKVEGIVYSEARKAALINGLVVTEGEQIGENKIVSIMRKKVIVRNENGIFSLNLDSAGAGAGKP